MSKNDTYNIDKDFENLPRFTFNFHPASMFLMNCGMKLMRFIQKRHYRTDTNVAYATSDDGTPIKLIIMRPNGIDDDAPVLIYYHGGAFALTYGSAHLDMAEEYAIGSSCVVVFVEYRLSPKHVFPIGFNDCYHALQWTVNHADTLGINSSKIVVSGDSAGGAMAISVAMRARDENLVKLCGQMLIYPVLDSRCITESANEFVDVPFWNAESNRRMWNVYLKTINSNPESKLSQYASPLAGDVSELPKTYIESAEFDPLRDEAHLLIDKLIACGDEPIANKTKGTVHAYDFSAKAKSNAISQQAVLLRMKFLNMLFNE